MARVVIGAILFVSIVAISPSAAMGQARPKPTLCSERPGEPTGNARVRPIQIAVCAYDGAEFKRRLLGVLGVKDGKALSVELLERAFGLPVLHSAYDSPHIASYTVIVEPALSREGWKLMLSFREGFWPAIPSRPARFQGTMRPALINWRERGDRSLEISWLGPKPPSPGSPACLSIEALGEAGRKRGWREHPAVPIMSSHGQEGWSFELHRADLRVVVPVHDSSICIADLKLQAAADPPIPPITPEEQAALGQR